MFFTKLTSPYLQVSQDVQASSKSQQAVMDSIQHSVCGLMSDMNKHGVAIDSALEGTTSAMDTMLSEVCGYAKSEGGKSLIFFVLLA